MTIYFVLNLLLAVVWPILIRGSALADFFVGFVLGAFLISFVEPDYGYRAVRLPLFVVTVLWEVILSSVEVAIAVLRPNSQFRQGVIALPLEARDAMEIIVLASVITLTPGTVSVNLGRDEEGGRILFVHVLMLDDPDELIAHIKERFEQQILRITRGRGYAA